jgi:hypothetical protein
VNSIGRNRYTAPSGAALSDTEARSCVFSGAKRGDPVYGRTGNLYQFDFKFRLICFRYGFKEFFGQDLRPSFLAGFGLYIDKITDAFHRRDQVSRDSVWPPSAVPVFLDRATAFGKYGFDDPGDMILC